MANSPDTDKRQIGLRVKLDLYRATVKQFSREGDKGDANSFIRAIREAVDMHDGLANLTAEDYAWCAKEAKRNAERFNKRERRVK